MKKFVKTLKILITICLFFSFTESMYSRTPSRGDLNSPAFNDNIGLSAESVTLRIEQLKKERKAIRRLLKSIRFNKAQSELGKLLFFDKIISGNKNISCATCHHTLIALGDGLSLSIGEGGSGLGITRTTGQGKNRITERIPRNAPHIFNLGLTEIGYFQKMFWDGRVAVDKSFASGFISPAKNDLPTGLINVLAAQAMFPVTSQNEMAGQAGENRIADATAAAHLAGEGGVWDLVAKRLRRNKEYVSLFKSAFKDVKSARDITYVHAANAIAVFEAEIGMAHNSPFDQYLLGDANALNSNQRKGLKLFYGKGRCFECHSGVLQTDDQFHSVAFPQIGPGKGDGPDGNDDFGRERETGNQEDRYKFRTPSLRNSALTAPYGHSGAFSDLISVLFHHIDPDKSLSKLDKTQILLPTRKDLDRRDYIVYNDLARRASLAKTSEMPDVKLSEKELMEIISYLHSLTDPNSLNLHRFTPLKVPSGLPVRD